MRYFLQNPEAADSLEGIARWRLLEMQVRDVVAETDAALALLVEQDLVEQVPIAGGPFLFRLKKERLGAVKQDFARLTLGMFAASFSGYPLTFTYAGKAEALLHLLSERGRPVKSEELREILATTPSNLSHLLTDLAQSQLVERVPVGREAHVTLTAQGKGWVAANPGAASASPVAVAEAVVSTAYQRARMAELARYDSPLAAMAGHR